MRRRKPTRRDLLLVIGELQGIISQMGSTYANDRAKDRSKPMQELEALGHRLCVDARSFDPPIEGTSRGGWPFPAETPARARPGTEAGK